MTADHCNRGLLLYIKLKEVSKSRWYAILLLTVPPCAQQFVKVGGGQRAPRAPWGRRLWLRCVNFNRGDNGASVSTQARSYQVSLKVSNETNNCLHTPYQSKFASASRGFPATARFSCSVIVTLAMLMPVRCVEASLVACSWRSMLGHVQHQLSGMINMQRYQHALTLRTRHLSVWSGPHTLLCHSSYRL